MRPFFVLFWRRLVSLLTKVCGSESVTPVNLDVTEKPRRVGYQSVECFLGFRLPRPEPRPPFDPLDVNQGARPPRDHGARKESLEGCICVSKPSKNPRRSGRRGGGHVELNHHQNCASQPQTSWCFQRWKGRGTIYHWLKKGIGSACLIAWRCARSLAPMHCMTSRNTVFSAAGEASEFRRMGERENPVIRPGAMFILKGRDIRRIRPKCNDLLPGFFSFRPSTTGNLCCGSRIY